MITIFKNIPELENMLIATKEGFPIFSALSRGIDETKLAAINASLITLAKKTISVIGLGNLSEIYIRGKKGHVLGLDVNDDVFLTTSVKRDVRLGLIFLDLKRLVERIKSGRFDGWGDNDLPYPYIFKPPSPPGDLGMVGQAQLKNRPKKEEIWDKPYCKNCGSIIPEGQSICHVCKKKIG
ncbi:MAG: roadblock/LC7 domain-containing protein [Promethearchaeota archaeon]